MTPALLLAVLALRPSGPDAAIGHPSQANDAARKILADDKYTFCSDEEYPLTAMEAAWCPPVSPELNPRCPAFHHACNAPRSELEHLGRLNFNRGTNREGDDDGEVNPDGTPRKRSEEDRDSGAAEGGDAGDGDSDSKRKTPDREVLPEDEENFQMPELGGFAYYLFWIVLGAGVVFLIYVIARNSSRDRSDSEEPTAPEALELGPERPSGPSEQVVRDVNALLEQARTAASAGDFNKAIRHTHAALLHRLDHDGMIRVAPFRTNGDYISDLKPQPDLRSNVREIVRDVEQVQFGTTPADASRFDRVFKKVVPIATRRAETLVLLLASTLLSCTCGEFRKSYPYDHSPSGTKAVVELAAHHGRTLDFLEVPLAELPLTDRGRAILLFHDVFIDADTWKHIIKWVDAGNHLVVAGTPPPADLSYAYSSDSAGKTLKVSPDEQDDYSDLSLVVPHFNHLVLPESSYGSAPDPLLVREDGKPYAARLDRGYRDGTITVFADDRLFLNGSMMLADNPRFVAQFFTDLTTGPIDMVDSMLELGSDSPAETISNSNLTATFLQLLALIALLYFSRGVRFGAPRDPPTRSRRHYTEHIDAVGQHYARARASRHALRQYSAWAIERLRDKTLTARQPGLYALAQAIAGRTGDDETRLMQLLVEATGIRDDESGGATTTRPRPHTVAEDLRLMQELARLVRLVGGPR